MGKTALFSAARDKELGSVLLLLEKGADQSALPRGLADPLLTAVDQDNAAAVQQLLGMGALDPAVDYHSGLGSVALIMAAEFERVGPVKCLLKGGVRTDARGEGGRTALMAGAPRWSQEMMDVLLRAGADVNARDDEGKSTLYHAVRGYCREAVEMLLGHGADVDARDGGLPPVLAAIETGSVDMVSALVESRPSRDCGGQGFDSLFNGVQGRGIREMVRALRDAGVRI